jgi:hypothetical protein
VTILPSESAFPRLCYVLAVSKNEGPVETM